MCINVHVIKPLPGNSYNKLRVKSAQVQIKKSLSNLIKYTVCTHTCKDTAPHIGKRPKAVFTCRNRIKICTTTIRIILKIQYGYGETQLSSNLAYLRLVELVRVVFVFRRIVVVVVGVVVGIVVRVVVIVGSVVVIGVFLVFLINWRYSKKK